MRFKLITLIAATFLLAACTSDEEVAMTADTTTSATTSTTTAPTAIAGPTPGSQEDLVVNVGDRVFYDFDRSDLRPEARTTVEALAVWMNSYPATTIAVEGHADERGTREYNLALGERRANAVKQYLIDSGVRASLIDTVSFGESQPAVVGRDDAAYSLNRRAEFRVVN